MEVLIEEANEAARATDNPRERREAQGAIGIALARAGYYVEAEERARAIVEDEHEWSKVQIAIVDALAQVGRYDEAERRLGEVIAVAAATRDLAGIGSAQIAHCILTAARGKVADTIAPLEALLGAVTASGARQVVQYLRMQLGRAKLLAGDAAGAAIVLDVTDETEPLRHSYIYRLTRTCHAEALVELGMVDQARNILDEVEADLAARGEAGTLVHCVIVRAKIALASDDLASASLAYEQAAQRAAALSLQSVFKVCESGLAVIASRQAETPTAA